MAFLLKCGVCGEVQWFCGVPTYSETEGWCCLKCKTHQSTKKCRVDDPALLAKMTAAVEKRKRKRMS